MGGTNVVDVKVGPSTEDKFCGGLTSSPLPDQYRERLESLVREIGEAGTIRRLGIARNTLVRSLARLPLRRGTVLMIREALKADAQANP